MQNIKLKVKKLSTEAVLPSYSRVGDAAMDLTAISKEYDAATDTIVMGTGLAIEIPPNHVGLICPRSSIYKVPLMLSNSIGIIDENFRGHIQFRFRPIDRPKQNYEVGDRIGQLLIIPYPTVEVEEVTELSESNRGEQGWGSSGK